MTESAGDHLPPPAPAKQTKAAEELAAMIHRDLSEIDGCPQRGVKVTVYGFNRWNAMMTYGLEAGGVPNKRDLLALFDLLVERMKRLYDVQ